MQSGTEAKEDSDAWLHEGPEDIERELKAHQANADAAAKPSKADPRASDEAFDPAELASRMQVGSDTSQDQASNFNLKLWEMPSRSVPVRIVLALRDCATAPPPPLGGALGRSRCRVPASLCLVFCQKEILSLLAAAHSEASSWACIWQQATIVICKLQHNEHRTAK